MNDLASLDIQNSHLIQCVVPENAPTPLRVVLARPSNPSGISNLPVYFFKIWLLTPTPCSPPPWSFQECPLALEWVGIWIFC